MEAALSVTLEDVQKISCLVNDKCEIEDFTCAKSSDSAFSLSFKLSQTADMTDITILTKSADAVRKPALHGVIIGFLITTSPLPPSYYPPNTLPPPPFLLPP